MISRLVCPDRVSSGMPSAKIKVMKMSLPVGRKRRNAGFTFIETLVALGVLGIFFAAMALIIQQVLENVGSSRVRSTAIALAQERMELVRNLPYNSVGTVGGIPQGSLPQSETVTVNGLPFTVKSSVVYIDDQFDGIAPNDLINTDYKRVRIEITWGGAYPSITPLAFVTNIVPRGVETIVGGGTMYIQVFNANAQPVSNATVTIDNTAVTPAIHTQTLTNANGLIVLPGAPACVNCYQISVTKTGHSTDSTYSTAQVTNPLQPHATVIEGQLTQISFSIDQLSNITVQSFGPGPTYPPIANVIFTLRGTKIIGTDSSDNPVYKYSYTTNTGGGIVNIPNLEWDNYTLDFTDSAHNLSGSTPTMPFAVNPNTSHTIPIVAVPKTNTTLLVTAKDGAGLLQASATAQLTHAGLGVSLTKVTAATGSPDFGQAFFGSLTPSSNYQLRVSLPGYQDATATMTLSGTRTESITLNPMP